MSKQRGVEARIIKASAPVEKAETSTEIYAYSESDAGGFMSPPTDLRGYKRLVNHSSILPQCIKAYKSNIAGFGIGVRYKDDIEETREMRTEWDKMSEVLQFLSIDQATKEVFEDVIEARETYGIAYLEVIRNFAGEVIGIEFIDNIPSVQKTAPLSPYVEVEYEMSGKTAKRQKKFCKYRQQLNGKTVYFKEIGDPRIMDNRTGDYRDSVPIEYQANELLEFAIGTEPYGEVRWIGTVLNVDGSRKAENLNNRYFSEGRHTPLMILINGGTLTDDSFNKLQGYMNDIKGENGQHAFIVLEAENLDSRTDMDVDAKPNLEVVKMADVLQKDELFQDYLDNNRRKVQSAFQLPDLYVGYTTDFNRATAQSAQEVTEKQVFQPERESLAWVINHKLLADYHFKYVEAYFLEPDISNSDDLYKILTVCNNAGGLTPNKAKSILYKAMGETAEDYEGDWGDVPLAYTKNQSTPTSTGLDQQISQQIQKSVEHNDLEIAAVLKEIRAFLMKSQNFKDSGFTFTENSDIIKKGWVTNEDGERIYISGGSVYGGHAGYTQYQSDLSSGNYAPTPSAGATSDASSGKSSSDTISEVREDLEETGIEAREVSTLDSQPSENDIISKVGGPDQTEGSCSSLALAFMAQENGLDVLDYRDGESRAFFASAGNIERLTEIEGVESVVERTFNEQETAMRLVGECEEGKNYYLAVGEHAAIVKNTESGAKYLELQGNSDENGWHTLNTVSLETRFNARQSRTVDGHKLQTSVILIKSESLRNNQEYKNVMSYINTAEDKQKKGAGGYAK